MTRLIATTWFCMLSLLAGVGLLTAQIQPKTSKELFDYINQARTLGLRDNQIKKNALNAGWDQETVEQTFSIVHLLNNEKPEEGAGDPVPVLRLPAGYRIGAGDSLQIAVWKEPEASVPEVVVRADGKISVPLIKEVDAAGLTPSELEKVLTDKFAKLINSPDVTVVPKVIRSLKIYLTGGVKREGPMPLLTPLTVLQAINEAGGLTEYAKRKKIYILRQENNRQIRLMFDYQAVIKGQRLEQNIFVHPNDMIVVPD